MTKKILSLLISFVFLCGTNLFAQSNGEKVLCNDIDLLKYTIEPAMEKTQKEAIKQFETNKSYYKISGDNFGFGKPIAAFGACPLDNTKLRFGKIYLFTESSLVFLTISDITYNFAKIHLAQNKVEGSDTETWVQFKKGNLLYTFWKEPQENSYLKYYAFQALRINKDE